MYDKWILEMVTLDPWKLGPVDNFDIITTVFSSLETMNWTVDMCTTCSHSALNLFTFT